MEEEKQKILLCGDVEGKFNTLFKRINAVIQKSGPFDSLLCVGNFFGINNREFKPYKSGEKKVPIPVYILGPNKEDQGNLYPENLSEIAPNIYYLGKRGIYVNSKGLKIAYLSGIASKTSNNFEYSEQDITNLYDICVRGNPSFRGVDILLTSQWPDNITVEDPKQTPISPSNPSELACWLIMKLKPRYHVSGLEGYYYERPPFRCPNLGEHDTTLETVTRFISLARVGNANKDKWLYALSLTPLDKMKISELLQKTTDETACPYNFLELEQKIFKSKRKLVNTTQYFYETNIIEEETTKGRKQKKQKIEFDQNKCWFCLASPSVEKHLIITVGNSAYLALAKGGLVDEHLLICPIEHYQNSLAQTDEVVGEINQFKESLHKFYGRNNQVPVFFERNYKTSHMQLQAVPISKQATRELKEIFMDEAEAQGFKLQVLDANNRLDQVLPAKTPYFTVELPDKTILYTKIQGHFPLNFGREVLASGPVLNMVNRIEWKDCILKREEEEVLIQRLRTDFEPFDFTI